MKQHRTDFTLQDVKNLKADPDVKNSFAEMVTAKAFAESTRKYVDSYRDFVLIDFNFLDHKGNKINEIDNLYQCDAPEAEFDEVWIKLHKLHIQNGYTPEEIGECPALIAEHNFRQSRSKFLANCDFVLRTTFSEVFEQTKRNQIVDLLSKIMLSK